MGDIIIPAGGDPTNTFETRIRAIRSEVDGLMWGLWAVVETEFSKDRTGAAHQSEHQTRMLRELCKAIAYRAERLADPRRWADVERWARDCGALGVPGEDERK